MKRRRRGHEGGTFTRQYVEDVHVRELATISVKSFDDRSKELEFCHVWALNPSRISGTMCFTGELLKRLELQGRKEWFIFRAGPNRNAETPSRESEDFSVAKYAPIIQPSPWRWIMHRSGKKMQRIERGAINLQCTVVRDETRIGRRVKVVDDSFVMNVEGTSSFGTICWMSHLTGRTSVIDLHRWGLDGKRSKEIVHEKEFKDVI